MKMRDRATLFFRPRADFFSLFNREVHVFIRSVLERLVCWLRNPLPAIDEVISFKPKITAAGNKWDKKFSPVNYDRHISGFDFQGLPIEVNLVLAHIAK